MVYQLLILLSISVVESAVLHYHFEYYVTPGHWSFGSKVVVGWTGASAQAHQSLGIGQKNTGSLHYEDVWYIPAILGALALIIVAVDVATMAMMRSGDTSLYFFRALGCFSSASA